MFDKLVARLVLGGSYQAHADDRVSATTLRARRDEWITAGMFDRLEQAALEAYDTVVGLDLGELVVDGCIVKAPCGGDNTGKSPVDRAKSRLKRSLLDELGCTWQISPKGQFVAINHTHRWKVQRTNSWHTRGFRALQIVTDRHERIQRAWIALANVVIIVRRLIRTAWTTHRWDTRPHRRP